MTLREKQEIATHKQIEHATAYLFKQKRLLQSEYDAIGKIMNSWESCHARLYWGTLGYIEGKCEDSTLIYGNQQDVCDFISTYIRMILDSYHVQ